VVVCGDEGDGTRLSSGLKVAARATVRRLASARRERKERGSVRDTRAALQPAAHWPILSITSLTSIWLVKVCACE
jgi:hypothetical protein